MKFSDLQENDLLIESTSSGQPIITLILANMPTLDGKHVTMSLWGVCSDRFYAPWLSIDSELARSSKWVWAVYRQGEMVESWVAPDASPHQISMVFSAQHLRRRGQHEIL